MSVVAVAVGVGAVNAYSSYKAGKAQKKAVEAQNRQAEEQYRIDQEFYLERVKYSDALHDYSIKQQEFAFEQKAYAEKQYQTALTNIANKYAYDQEMLANKKKAAVTQFNADKLVANIVRVGADEQISNIAKDSYRALGANVREQDRQLSKQVGKITAALNSGLAQGTSAERASAEAYINRNVAVANLSDKTKAGVLNAVAQGNKVINDTNLKVAQSYRDLQAIMKLKVPPMQQLAGPTPVFTERAPDAPVAPVGASPAEIPTASNFAIGLGAVSTGLNTGMGVYNQFS